MINPSEKEILERCKSGDKDAFQTIVENYRKKIFAVALGMLGEPELALDVTQESFLKAYVSIKSFRGGSSFYTWLYRITINCALDQIRKGKKADVLKEKEESLIHEGLGEAGELQRTNDPQNITERIEMREAIMKAIGELPEEQRAAILLREIEGLSYHEIGEALGCSKGTVMSRLHYARKKIQALLKDYL